MNVKRPSEANGPDGYPLDNAAFRAAADKVLAERKHDLERARSFREKLRKDARDLIPGEKIINMIKKFVIRDQTHNLYVQCWTENETIFLTSNLDNIEYYKSLDDAKLMIERIIQYECRFLRDSPNEEELTKVSLEAGTLEIQTIFIPVK